MRTRNLSLGALVCTTLVAATVGCRNHMPHAFTWPYGGDMQRSYAKPPGSENWDPYAATIEITPVEAVNPVRTQHVLIATVKDKEGRGLPNRRVEWVLGAGSVGDIIDVHSAGWRQSRGIKVDNAFAVTHTSDGDERNFLNNKPDRIDMGTEDESDDIILQEGQSWIVISSQTEGETFITAYAPGIYDWSQHKAFAVKRWYDVKWECPADDTNPTGTPHELITRVTRVDGSPLEGYEVTYTLRDGPAGSFTPGGTVLTDASGVAKVTLNQATPAEGTNTIDIAIVRPANMQCCKPAVPIATCQARKTWLGPKIAIQKDCQATATIGDEFPYNIVVTNPGQVPAKSVVVSDPIPDGMQYVSSNPPAQASGNSLTWNAGDLAGGGSWRATVTVKAVRQGTFPNTASVRTAEGLTAQDGCETKVGAPALTIEKKCPPTALLCDVIEHTIVVRNSGDSPARNVKVVDALPEGLTTTDGKTSLMFDGGTIDAGQAKQAKFTVKAARTGRFVNRATATADGGLSAEASCETVVSKPDLAVTKSAPEVRYIGRDVTFDITVTNRGDAPARDTILTDTLPAGLSFVSADGGGTSSGSTVTWNLGTLEPGQSRAVKVTARASSAISGENQAMARAYCAEGQASAPVQVKGIPAVLLEVVDDPDPIEIGSNTTYTIVVTNQGSAVDRNIKIVAEAPAEQQIVAGEGATRGTISGQTITFEPLPELAPKARVTWTITVKANQPGDVRFKVIMTTQETGGVPVQETEATRLY